jgi:hypothetical protein
VIARVALNPPEVMSVLSPILRANAALFPESRRNEMGKWVNGEMGKTQIAESQNIHTADCYFVLERRKPLS